MSERERIARALAAVQSTIDAAVEMKLMVREYFQRLHEHNMAHRHSGTPTFGDYLDAFTESAYWAGKALSDTAKGVTELLTDPGQFVENLRTAYRELGLLGAVNQFNPAYHMLTTGHAYV